MSRKTFPLTLSQVNIISQTHPTPFHLYDEAQLREQVRQLTAAFAWNNGFREYFALKATPNPYILQILHEEGCGADCSSLAELALAERVGLHGDEILFTSNNTPIEEYCRARELGALINLDDLGHIVLLEELGLPPIASLRYNPGPLRTGNAIIGDPREAKFGVTREQLFEGYRVLRDKGMTRFGLHAMVVSNERDPQAIVATARMLFELAMEIAANLEIQFEFINIGGGIGIPYKPEDDPVDLQALGTNIEAAYKQIITGSGHPPVRLLMECGRLITGPAGYLVTRVRHIKDTYKQYVGLDATMADLMRPAMYNAYHHTTVLGKEQLPQDRLYDLTGSLCENNDKFAINRALPEIERGDVVVIHDTGAHGHAMGFNYNGKLRAAELLLRPDGTVQLIRRRETLDDYFATLDFPGATL